MSEPFFISPQSVLEASRLIKERPGAFFMAGGTDLLVLQKHGLINPRGVIFLKSIPGLSEMRENKEGGLVIGAGTTLDEVSRHGLVKERYPMLAEASCSAASPQIRHKATLGGNICLSSRCWFYNHSSFWRAEYPECRKASGGKQCYILPKSPKGCFALQSGDTVGPLVALGAELKIASDEGERILNMEKLFTGDGIHYLDLRPGEIVSEVRLPPLTGRGGFVKFRPQNNLDFATFTLSVILPRSGKGSRIVVASVATKPLRAHKAEAMLDEGRDTQSIARQVAGELNLVSPVRGEVDYKRRAIEARMADLLIGIGGPAGN